jgi:hypothetical protein
MASSPSKFPAAAAAVRIRLACHQTQEDNMHAVVVRVTINDVESAEKVLREQTVPGVSQVPGFVAGYWTRSGNGGLSMVVFDSEEAATAASERVPSFIPDAVTLEDVEVREVVAHA